MSVETITYDTLPKAVNQLIEQVAEIKTAVEKLLPMEKRTPIGIDDACQILQKAKPTVYALVRTGSLPCYKSGKKLYFYEDELLKYIEQGRKKTTEEIEEEINQAFYSPNSKRPTYQSKYSKK
ncbi:excisionase family DNA binding protein [Parabacteroides sp. PFB2-12]|uniref:helix-turn-helix domain-containing protein n=1 Tax=unclassified Parabacteroides TaxID=2649774 RepID=UPI00247723EF|nr:MULTISPECIES: helix-turn-helix domain-containing protein [unclassified Parabacteroides]MDH6343761.1 excisionase family DNA binding protein [Parabacteroides sp. PM6-13]MDH6391923.1 excisionase family DNA binding protein [Parabacteroides sp. PFB2-12]